MPVHALQIQYRFLCSHAPDMVTTFSASLARSYRRVASPEAVCFPAAAIQLLMRFIYETGNGPLVSFGGSPALRSQFRAGDFVRLPARRQPPQGDGAAGLYKSVPEQIVSVMTARLPPPLFSRASFRPFVHAAPAPPAFYALFSPARAARTGVRTLLGTALSVPAGNCSRPGRC